MSVTSPAVRHVRSVESSITVCGSIQETWDEITNVDIASDTHPAYFRLFGIPNPLRAEIESAGVSGRRIAYFDNGKRFIQAITIWEPLRKYSFTFNPEKGFKVLFFFDLSDGVVQIPTGTYWLSPDGTGTKIRLGTQYSIDRAMSPILAAPVRLSLRLFQRYLLKSIRRNVEAR